MKITNKKFCSIFSVLCVGLLLFTGLTAGAAERSSGDLKVSGGEYGKDYRYEGNTLLILTDRPMTISGTTKKEGIRIKEGTDAVLTLKGLDIRSGSGCALDAGDGRLSLKLSGSNYIKSGAKYPGIWVRDGASVTVSGGKQDSLMVFGGSQCAGIGSEKGEAFGEIVVTGGTITATGGARAAGIGNGYQGAGGAIQLKGGRVNAFGGAGAADLGCPQEGYGSGSTVLDGDSLLNADRIGDGFDFRKGILLSGKQAEICGKVQLSYPLTIKTGQVMVIPRDSTLVIPEGLECVNQGEIYVYGKLDVSGTLKNGGEIYDYDGTLSREPGITGNQVTVRDIYDISLLNGSVLFTEDGYEQGGMDFTAENGAGGVYTVHGEGMETDAGITVADGVRVDLILEDAKLAPEKEYALSLGDGASAVLILSGDNYFLGGKDALSGCILTGKDAVLELKGSGSLTTESQNGGKIILRGNGDDSGIPAEGTEEENDGEEAPEDGADKEKEPGPVSGEEAYAVPVTENAGQMEILLPREELELLVDERRAVAVRGKMLEIVLDWRAVREVLEGTAGDAGIRIRPFTPGQTFTNAILYIGERPVYDIQVIDIAAGSEKNVNIHFKEGTATVSIPYRKPAGEDIRKLYLVYVGADNTLDWLKDSYYDETEETMVSSVKHFSVYGVGYQIG